MRSSSIFDVHAIMANLSRQRPVFHSEADFQHAFAWQVHSDLPESQVRLEYRPQVDERVHIDMWIANISFAIELKYRIRQTVLQVANERFELRQQSAQDHGRYDFLKDLRRLESLEQQGLARSGLAILLTNDHLYWEHPRRLPNLDKDFRIHEGQQISGSLKWSNEASAGTTRSREQPINLKGTHNVIWHDYADVPPLQPPETNSRVSDVRFRYLAIKVDTHPASI